MWGVILTELRGGRQVSNHCLLGGATAVPSQMCRSEDGGMLCLSAGMGKGGVIGPEVIGRHLN